MKVGVTGPRWWSNVKKRGHVEKRSGHKAKMGSQMKGVKKGSQEVNCRVKKGSHRANAVVKGQKEGSQSKR